MRLSIDGSFCGPLSLSVFGFALATSPHVHETYLDTARVFRGMPSSKAIHEPDQTSRVGYGWVGSGRVRVTSTRFV